MAGVVLGCRVQSQASGEVPGLLDFVREGLGFGIVLEISHGFKATHDVSRRKQIWTKHLKKGSQGENRIQAQ